LQVPYIFSLQALTFVIGTAIWKITSRPSSLFPLSHGLLSNHCEV
jgi:hypothetical protein